MADRADGPPRAAAAAAAANDDGLTPAAFAATTTTTTPPAARSGGGPFARFRRRNAAAPASSKRAGSASGGKGGGGKLDEDDDGDDVVDAGDLPGIVLPRRPNPLSRLLFLFVDPLIFYGYRHTLGPAELYKPPAVETESLYGSFDAAWQAQRAAADASGGKKKPDIKVAVFRGSSGGLLFTGALYAVSTACSLVGPMMLRNVVNGLSCQAAAASAAAATAAARPQPFAGAAPAAPAALCPTRQTLYLYLIALCGAPLVQSLSENQMNFALNVIGTRMRNALMAAIYRKCLRLTNAALQAESAGRVVTLMSNDAQKVQDAMLAIHTAWGAPALIVVILALLYQQVGWATFVGLAVMLVYSPLTGGWLVVGGGGFARFFVFTFVSPSSVRAEEARRARPDG
jgi:ATP-binding cassette subfamily C (CFTR/MRP) protein 1